MKRPPAPPKMVQAALLEVRGAPDAGVWPRLYTTAEAASFLRYRSSSGIRTAVLRGLLQPLGSGPRGTHLFILDELLRFVGARSYGASRPETRVGRDLAEAQAGHEDQILRRLSSERQQHRLCAIAVDPRVSAQETARMRSELMQEIRVPAPEARGLRVGEFARSWMKSKTISIDPATARTYANTLDQHVLPVFGDFWFDALTKNDVQQWVNASLTSTYETKGGKQ